MSTSVERAVAACRPTEIEPVELTAESLESTAPEYLRELKRELGEEGYQPAAITVEGCFDEDCSLATQEEADRLRGFVRAASFLGAGTVTVTVDEVGDAEKVRPALSALAERAHREGVTLTVEGLELPAWMGGKRALAERLHGLAGFRSPDLSLEQYPTPPDLTAHIVHLADLQGDLADRTVLDLGTGTGLLALAAACRVPDRVLGLERDPEALAVARENERAVDPPRGVDWVLGDATRPPLCPDGAITTLMNPPFGAQRGSEGADRAFLATAAALSTVSYSVHNAGSQQFVESFAADEGGAVTHAFRAEFELSRLYDHHDRDRTEIDVEVFRIVWD